MNASGSSRSAFTLIELLVTVAIIGALSSMLLPALSRGKESGQSAVCQGNLHQIGLALQMYVDENGNRMPAMYDFDPTAITNRPSIDVVLTNQLGSQRVLRCPSDFQQIFETTRSSYAWNTLLNGQNADQLKMITTTVTTRIPLVFDKQHFHSALGPKRGVNYLYADGHIRNRFVLSGK
jgi:prepilin-type N-terminal cleavage/methylation domain-containing protein/prepilin-type processing-associated H-X9-DG protein